MKNMSNYRNALRSTIFVIFFSFILFSCSSRDSFYETGSGWDYVRFPLIKPYFAISSTDSNAKWVIPLQNELPLSKVPFLFDIVDVEKIDVVDNVIMVYTPDSTKYGYNEDDEQTLHWYILMPDEQMEIAFENENDFLEYLREKKLDEPEWMEPLVILQTYDQTGCLDWIPDCK